MASNPQLVYHCDGPGCKETTQIDFWGTDRTHYWPSNWRSIGLGGSTQFFFCCWECLRGWTVRTEDAQRRNFLRAQKREEAKSGKAAGHQDPGTG